MMRVMRAQRCTCITKAQTRDLGGGGRGLPEPDDALGRAGRPVLSVARRNR